QVLLRHPVVLVGVRVEVTLAMTKTLSVSVRVLEVIGNLGLALLLDGRQRVEERHRRVALRCRGQVEGRLRQVEAPLRHTYVVVRARRSRYDLQGVRISQPDVLAREDKQASEDEARVLARVYHLGQPVEGGVGI